MHTHVRTHTHIHTYIHTHTHTHTHTNQHTQTNTHTNTRIIIYTNTAHTSAYKYIPLTLKPALAQKLALCFEKMHASK